MVTLLFKYLHFKIQVGVQSYMTYIRNSEKTRSVKKGDLKEANYYISGLSKSGFHQGKKRKKWGWIKAEDMDKKTVFKEDMQ